ncbi:hypothetical protein [Gloeocapsopsis dulcis]|uniref:Uncharacterized protein n=1 Tax=Gloeocapsopsis dulcis AAB1 = 1H9 TaxID=1433147 RepID=A0A6N8FSG3_9CHRO|nr:hypothetical protein [Gloeocapsopsis dulcis]MUL34876.1 hypothetical protein [Gloeocapsopsis dulcis AAB1 = 1H9]WNN90055.1 hypothetical protein P0S91_02845 [Gloeocapsopsis dulcis]
MSDNQELDIIDGAAPTSDSNREVLVEILLNGGFRYQIKIKSDNPLLRSLIAAFLARTQGKKDSFLFQIPIQENKSSLCFTSDHLVGLITEPPILLRRKQELE